LVLTSAESRLPVVLRHMRVACGRERPAEKPTRYRDRRAESRRADSAATTGDSVVDPVFGTISWQLDPGRLLLTGDGVPDVELVRTGSVDPRKGIPIGTRRRRDLTMTVAGQDVELSPASERLTRRSYRIAIGTHTGNLLFTPCSPTETRLVRGSSYRGDNELGTFERATDGWVFARWSDTITALGVVVEAPAPEPAEAAIGYALAAGFGTGARFLLATCTDALEQLLPF